MVDSSPQFKQLKSPRYTAHSKLEVKHRVRLRQPELTAEAKEATPENVIAHIEKRAPYFLNLLTVYSQVLDTKPPEVQRRLEREYPYGITWSVFLKWLGEWDRSGGAELFYGDDEAGYTKLAKDVIKFHLHKVTGWKSVGAAAYMTGDATGLALAASIDPTLTVKFLKGRKSADQPNAPTVVKDGRLPSSFDEPTAKNKIRVSETDTKLDKRIDQLMAETLYQKITEPKKTRKEIASHRAAIAKQVGTGTADVYKRRYNEHTAPALKPWNKETYHATKAVGDHYSAKRTEIADMLLPLKSDKTAEELTKIQHFMTTLGLRKESCVLIWQRLSGQKGGAHTELDSHPFMLTQIAKAISARFKDRTIILIGDETIDANALKGAGVDNRIVELNEYWNSPTAKKNGVFSTREHQNYFLKLLSTENNAVSVGMRSGSLESSALLGIPTIYLDNLGNNAQGRMEFWAGNAAYARGNLAGQPEEEWDKHEKANEGPIANYKRVATRNQLGSEAGARLKYFEGFLNAIKNAEATIQAPGAADSQAVSGDQEINDVIRAFDDFDQKVARLEGAKLPTEEPAAYKELQKQLGTLKSKIEGKENVMFTRERIDALQGKIRGAIDKAFLSPSEIEQIIYLIGYLSEQTGYLPSATGTKSPVVVPRSGSPS